MNIDYDIIKADANNNVMIIMLSRKTNKIYTFIGCMRVKSMDTDGVITLQTKISRFAKKAWKDYFNGVKTPIIK